MLSLPVKLMSKIGVFFCIQFGLKIEFQQIFKSIGYNQFYFNTALFSQTTSMFPFSYYQVPSLFQSFIPNQNYPYLAPTYYVPLSVITQGFVPQHENYNLQQPSVQIRPEVGVVSTAQTRRTRKRNQQLEEKEYKTTEKESKRPQKCQNQLRKIDKEMIPSSNRVQTRSRKRNLRIRKDKNQIKSKKSNRKKLSTTSRNKKSVQGIKQKQVTQSTIQIKNSQVYDYSESDSQEEYQPSSLKPAMIPRFVADMQEIKNLIQKKKQQLFYRMIRN